MFGMLEHIIPVSPLIGEVMTSPSVNSAPEYDQFQPRRADDNVSIQMFTGCSCTPVAVISTIGQTMLPDWMAQTGRHQAPDSRWSQGLYRGVKCFSTSTISPISSRTFQNRLSIPARCGSF